MATATLVQKPPKLVRRLAVNDGNMRRVFGMDLEAMFQLLAKRFGYDELE